MDSTSNDKRREPRFQLQAGATVGLKRGTTIVKATTVNISGCGVLLQFAEPVEVAVGDTVSCDFNLSSTSEMTVPCWAEGIVVRRDGACVAIDFRIGGWNCSPDTSPDKPR